MGEAVGSDSRVAICPVSVTKTTSLGEIPPEYLSRTENRKRKNYQSSECNTNPVKEERTSLRIFCTADDVAAIVCNEKKKKTTWNCANRHVFPDAKCGMTL